MCLAQIPFNPSLLALVDLLFQLSRARLFDNKMSDYVAIKERNKETRDGSLFHLRHTNGG